jgi:hypothetical protein
MRHLSVQPVGVAQRDDGEEFRSHVGACQLTPERVGCLLPMNVPGCSIPRSRKSAGRREILRAVSLGTGRNKLCMALL